MMPVNIGGGGDNNILHNVGGKKKTGTSPWSSVVCFIGFCDIEMVWQLLACQIERSLTSLHQRFKGTATKLLVSI